MKLTHRRLLASLAALGAVAGGTLLGRNALARYYDGPISDHFDGKVFFDKYGMAPKSLGEVARFESDDERQNDG